MRLTQASWKPGGRLLSLALLGGITFSPVGSGLSAPSSAAAAPVYSWLSLSDPWLCRTWSASQPDATLLLAVQNGIAAETGSQETAALASGGTTTHCTRRWHVDGEGYLISDSPAWVPNPGGVWPDPEISGPLQMTHAYAIRYLPAPTLAVHTVRRLAASVYSNPASTPPPPPPVSPPSGGYNAWAPVPGHPGYGMSDFAGDPWRGYFGVCTWYAWYRHQGEPLMKMGNAAAWAWNAPKFGLRTGTTPAVGATVVFQAGVEGAGSGGHAAHVEVVLGGGWFIVSEMNFGLNGGGWGRVDWRYAYVAPGVTFIY
ncbi:MAG: CHAP domain-containing protein [Ktedonobacterales bacterium]